MFSNVNTSLIIVPSFPHYCSLTLFLSGSDSPNTRPVNSEQFLQEHFYKTQLLRNAFKQTAAAAAAHLPNTLDQLNNQPYNINSAVSLSNVLTNSLTNVLANRYL